MAKKNEQSSPLAAIILVATLCVFAGIAYSKAQDAKALDVPTTISESQTFTDLTDWMYYDDFELAIRNGEVDVSYSLTPETLVYSNITDATPETIRVAEEVKNRLRERFGAYTGLNWPRFEATTIKECDFPAAYYGVEASYNAKENVMYCVRNMTLGQDESLLKLILAHEYIHALSSRADNCNSNLSEGTVEYLAHQAYVCDDIAYECAYAFAEAYAVKHGEEKTIEALINDSLGAEIDQDLGRNAMQNIDIMLQDASSANRRVVLDVYCHYIADCQDSVRATTARLLGELDSMYENRRAKAYFNSVLQ